MGVATADDSVAKANEVGGQVGTGTYTFKEGQEFTISILGVGWTQLDNTLAVDYDNSYIGYGCGFHSNGYMAVHLTATGGPGIHIIDLYPLLYSVSPNLAPTTAWCPLLSANHDDPGLALGYQVPSDPLRDPHRQVTPSHRGHGPALVGGAVTRSRRATGPGSHQLFSPSSAITLGSTTPRTIVASTSTPRLSPTPSSWSPATRPATRPARAPTMISAAALTTAPVRARPSRMAVGVSAPASRASRMRETMKTS